VPGSTRSATASSSMKGPTTYDCLAPPSLYGLADHPTGVFIAAPRRIRSTSGEDMPRLKLGDEPAVKCKIFGYFPPWGTHANLDGIIP
jgi:hypothetical protein